LERADGPKATGEDLRIFAADLARENELLHARLVEITDLAEEAVARQVEAERAREAVERELDALLHTRSMRVLRPFRAWYGRLRGRLGR